MALECIYCITKHLLESPFLDHNYSDIFDKTCITIITSEVILMSSLTKKLNTGGVAWYDFSLENES